MDVTRVWIPEKSAGRGMEPPCGGVEVYMVRRVSFPAKAGKAPRERKWGSSLPVTDRKRDRAQLLLVVREHVLV